MKIFATEKLTHTLQTWVGMVRDNGRPQQRPWSDLPNYLLNNESLSVKAKAVDPLSEKAFVLLFTSCVLECRLPQFNDPRFFIWQDRSEFDRDIARLKSNIHACCDFDVGIAFMKRNIRALQRLDLEQAAAIVISAIRNDASITNRMEIVSVLIQELDLRILTQSCMWLERRDLGTEDTVDEAKLSRLVNLFLRYLDKHNLIGSRDISDLGSSKTGPRCCRFFCAYVAVTLALVACSFPNGSSLPLM